MYYKLTLRFSKSTPAENCIRNSLVLPLPFFRHDFLIINCLAKYQHENRLMNHQTILTNQGDRLAARCNYNGFLSSFIKQICPWSCSNCPLKAFGFCLLNSQLLIPCVILFQLCYPLLSLFEGFVANPLVSSIIFISFFFIK